MPRVKDAERDVRDRLARFHPRSAVVEQLLIPITLNDPNPETMTRYRVNFAKTTYRFEYEVKGVHSSQTLDEIETAVAATIERTIAGEYIMGHSTLTSGWGWAMPKPIYESAGVKFRRENQREESGFQPDTK